MGQHDNCPEVFEWLKYRKGGRLVGFILPGDTRNNEFKLSYEEDFPSVK